MNILVTGGTGTVGRLLVDELRKRNHKVVSVDLAHGAHERGFTLRTDETDAYYARCDVGDYRQVERIFETMGPFDLVYHAAAEFGRWNGEDYFEQLWRTNAVGTKNFIRLQEKLKFRMVFFSSSEVYGDWDDVMSEDVMDKHEIRQLNDYALSKWVNECQIRNSVAQFGTESVILRLFNTYGPGEYYSPYRSVNCRFCYCAIQNLPWLVFKGHGRTSTYIHDCITTTANIAERFKPGETYNISGRIHHSIEELSDLVLKASGADKSLVTYKDAEPMTTKDKRVNNDKVVEELGHKDTVTLEEGVQRTVDWMREVYSG